MVADGFCPALNGRRLIGVRTLRSARSRVTGRYDRELLGEALIRYRRPRGVKVVIHHVRGKMDRTRARAPEFERGAVRAAERLEGLIASFFASSCPRPRKRRIEVSESSQLWLFDTARPW